MIAHPLKDRVFIEQDELAETTEGGVVLPETVREAEKPLRGTVRFTGPTVEHLHNGDRVAFTQYAGGQKINLDDETALLVMREDDVLCTLEDE